MKTFVKKASALFASALLLLSVTGCDFLYEDAIKNGVNEEFSVAKEAANSDYLPDSRIVNVIEKEVTFPSLTLTKNERADLTRALLKNFNGEVESVSINSRAGTATANCKITNVDMTKVAETYASETTTYTDEELIAMTWGDSKSKSTNSGEALTRYLEVLNNADDTYLMTSTTTVPLKLENEQWVPDFTGQLSSGLYKAITGGYSGSITTDQEELVLSAYNALFTKLSGISQEDFVAGKYFDHPLFAYFNDSYYMTTAETEIMQSLMLALLKNFSGTANSVTFNGETASLECTFSNGNMVIALNQFTTAISTAEAQVAEIYAQYEAGTITYSQAEDQVMAYVYGQLINSISTISTDDLLEQDGTIPLLQTSTLWSPDSDEIEYDSDLNDAMFGNFLSSIYYASDSLDF